MSAAFHKNPFSTALIHPDYQAPQGFLGVQMPIYKASTVLFDSVADMRQRNWQSREAYTYGLHGTPATFALEAHMAQIEGAEYARLAPSGLAAVACVNLACLTAGGEVLIPDNAYSPNKDMATGLLAGLGIAHQFYDPMNPQDLQARLGPRTQLVWLEAPGSVTLEFPPLLELVRLCRAHGVVCALDNTWGAGLAFRPFALRAADGQERQEPQAASAAALAVDLSIQALTKYASGGGDVLMGCISTCSKALFERVQKVHMHLGLGVGGDDVAAVLRALPSMALRYRAQDASARQLSAWLAQQDVVTQVLHPAWPDSPGHAHWRELCGAQGAAAGLVSVVLQAPTSLAQIEAFCERLRLFKLGYSWGGPLSLLMPYALDGMREHWPRHLLHGPVLRFCIGLEDATDLQADLQQAWPALQRPSGTAC